MTWDDAFELVLRLARGEAVTEAELAGVRAACAQRSGFGALRARADVLRAGAEASPVMRALGTELFRSQHRLNHAVVDVLEDLPWLGSRPGLPSAVEERLGALARFSAAPPRRAGPRGAAVHLAKRVAVRGARVVLVPELRALSRSNRAVLEALKSAGSSSAPSHLRQAVRHLGGVARLEPWLSAQQRFLEALERFFRDELPAALSPELAASQGAADALPGPTGTPGSTPGGGSGQRPPTEAVRAGSAPPSAPGLPVPHPTVTVLLTGRPDAPPDLPDALEVLCPAVPPGSGPNVRLGDVSDARGAVIVRLPPDEALRPGGLWSLAAPFSAPEVRLAYGDTQLAGGRAVFRPSWSPEFLLGESYVGGCFAVRTSVAHQHGLTRATPALGWLLSPRFEDHEVVRVPSAVSSRRAPAPGDPLLDAEAVTAELARRHVDGEVRLASGRRTVHLRPRPGTKVSLIVPFKDKVGLLSALWDSLRAHEAGVEWELLLASNSSVEPATFRFLEGLRDPRVRWFEWNQPFNYSAVNNAAASRASGELLLFLNNDMAVLHDGWLAGLAGYAQQPEIGVAGARLLYEGGALQHAGVVIGLRGLAGHVFARWRPEYGETPFGWPGATRNWSAVTGACLMMRRALFEELGGFDEGMIVSGSDIELCLRARRRGLRVVCVGHVALSHFESMSRGGDPVPRTDVLRELLSYGALLETGDPFYHPRLSSEAAHGGPGLRVEPPREHAVRAVEPFL